MELQKHHFALNLPLGENAAGEAIGICVFRDPDDRNSTLLSAALQDEPPRTETEHFRTSTTQAQILLHRAQQTLPEKLEIGEIRDWIESEVQGQAESLEEARIRAHAASGI